MLSSLFLGFAFFLTSAVSLDQPMVAIADGDVMGTTIMSTTNVPVNQYLGIPFAAPPDRFSPPVLPLPWTTGLNATDFAPSCPQQFMSQYTEKLFNYPDPPKSESEDCLYLNVFTPATPTFGGKAVMFWIYGGALQFGSSSLGYYNGVSLAANQDVVVVTANYRSNVLGFPNSPDLSVYQQNLGFLDQRLALEWVQANIAAFGGDPAKVTIFGESAGGYSVKQLFALPPVPLPFRAAIMQSEATSTGNGTASWLTLTSELGCTNATVALDCVRAANVTQVIDLISKNGLVFPPVVDNMTNVDHVETHIENKTVAPVPIMIGSNANEGTVFALNFNSVDQLLKYELGSSESNYSKAIAAAYPVGKGRTEFQAISEIITDAVFTCPTAIFANLTAAAGCDTWRYYFNATFPNTQVFTGAGAWHSSEIPEVFGTYLTDKNTTQQVDLSVYMQKAWADFAKDPMGGPGWPKMGSQQPYLQSLGGLGGDGGSAIAEDTVDTKCALFMPLVAAVGL